VTVIFIAISVKI